MIPIMAPRAWHASSTIETAVVAVRGGAKDEGAGCPGIAAAPDQRRLGWPAARAGPRRRSRARRVDRQASRPPQKHRSPSNLTARASSRRSRRARRSGPRARCRRRSVRPRDDERTAAPADSNIHSPSARALTSLSKKPAVPDARRAPRPGLVQQARDVSAGSPIRPRAASTGPVPRRPRRRSCPRAATASRTPAIARSSSRAVGRPVRRRALQRSLASAVTTPPRSWCHRYRLRDQPAHECRLPVPEATGCRSGRARCPGRRRRARRRGSEPTISVSRCARSGCTSARRRATRVRHEFRDARRQLPEVGERPASDQYGPGPDSPKK